MYKEIALPTAMAKEEMWGDVHTPPVSTSSVVESLWTGDGIKLIYQEIDALGVLFKVTEMTTSGIKG